MKDLRGYTEGYVGADAATWGARKERPTRIEEGVYTEEGTLTEAKTRMAQGREGDLQYDVQFMQPDLYG